MDISREIDIMRKLTSDIELSFKKSNNRFKAMNIMEFMSSFPSSHSNIEKIVMGIQGSCDITNVFIEDYVPVVKLDAMMENLVFQENEFCYIQDSRLNNITLVSTDSDMGILFEHITNPEDYIVYKLHNYNEGISFIDNLKAMIDKDNVDRGYECSKLDITLTKKKIPDFDIKESFSIDKDGNMKLKLRRKSSYMDQFDSAHKILIENLRNKNYEALKYDLAFMFAFISLLDSLKNDDGFNKLSKEKQEDIIKARAFAINDFKSSMKVLSKEEPKFNFTTFYKDGEFDKIELGVDIDTIIGIKKLFIKLMTQW